MSDDEFLERLVSSMGPLRTGKFFAFITSPQSSALFLHMCRCLCGGDAQGLPNPTIKKPMMALSSPVLLRFCGSKNLQKYICIFCRITEVARMTLLSLISFCHKVCIWIAIAD